MAVHDVIFVPWSLNPSTQRQWVGQSSSETSHMNTSLELSTLQPLDTESRSGKRLTQISTYACYEALSLKQILTDSET